jgi:hypothetical protein
VHENVRATFVGNDEAVTFGLVEPFRTSRRHVRTPFKRSAIRAADGDTGKEKAAEHRLGEMLAEQKATVGLARGTRGQLIGPSKTEAPINETPTLSVGDEFPVYRAPFSDPS